MTIEITHSEEFRRFTWKLWDGPDGIDYCMGYANSLGECFERIVVARQAITRQYVRD
jgi:hypothetical protein